ncbi:MAG: hypothetical protein HOD18_04955 [Candidatus Marinimicrobia bacterium]|jgi:transcriptional regulator with XRE-family HTH domain|nr:hypothetical protein [Candidatus Neomarinimicrobiota bacterium]
MPKQGIPVNREKIKNLRINLGFTQTELGGIAMEKKGLKKISLRTVQKIENDSNYLCSLKIINNLSNIFDVPINELLMDENFDDSKEQSDKESSTSIDEKFHENTKYQFKQNLLVPLKPSPASEKKLPAPEFHHFMTNDKDIEIDKGRKFSISELTLRCLEEHWSSDQACGHELWQYSPEKANVIENLRKFKFIPTSFHNLCLSVGDLDKSVYRIFYDHEYIPNPDTIHYMDEIDVDPVTGVVEIIDTRYRFDKGVENILTELSTAHFYSIDYDLPDNEEILEIMYELITRLEKYFEKKLSVAEELKFKFHVSSLRQQLYSKNISIFCSTSSSKKLGIGKNHGQVYLKAIHMRIIIKNWSNHDVIDLQNCKDLDMRGIADSFIRVEWRDFLEIEKQEED